MLMVSPVKPTNVVSLKKAIMPNEVIETFNHFIALNLSNNRASFKKDDVVAALIAKGYTKHDIYEKKYLDVEDIYRAEGWGVQYELCGFGGGNAMYHFTAK